MPNTTTSTARPNAISEQMTAFHHGGQSDYWVRKMGVPWDVLSQAVRAVSDRAAESFLRRLDDTPPSQSSTRQ